MLLLYLISNAVCLDDGCKYIPSTPFAVITYPLSITLPPDLCHSFFCWTHVLHINQLPRVFVYQRHLVSLLRHMRTRKGGKTEIVLEIERFL